MSGVVVPIYAVHPKSGHSRTLQPRPEIKAISQWVIFSDDWFIVEVVFLHVSAMRKLKIRLAVFCAVLLSAVIFVYLDSKFPRLELLKDINHASSIIVDWHVQQDGEILAQAFELRADVRAEFERKLSDDLGSISFAWMPLRSLRSDSIWRMDTMSLSPITQSDAHVVGVPVRSCKNCVNLPWLDSL